MLKTVSSVINAIGALNYKGTWNALTNSPTLASGVGTKGDYYVVSVAGSTNLDGITDWQVGDWAVFNGSVWQKIDNSDLVVSVNGQTGVVVLGPNDVGATANTTYVLVSGLLSGGGRLNGNVTVSMTSVPSANVTGTVANSVVYTDGSNVFTTGTVLTFNGTTLTNNGNAIISDNSANAALRITQTGAGNALLVEDSANPDSTPFVINADGQVGVGGTPSAGRSLTISKTLTGATTSSAVRADGQIQSDVTSEARGYSSNISVVDAAFTLSSLRHFYAGTGTIGASATVTTQYGFFAESTLTGATNNYGFYSNIAAGTGRWNFYAGGTARNYFEGFTSFGTTAGGGGGSGSYRFGGNITGSTSSLGIFYAPSVLSDVTTTAAAFTSQPSTQATSFTLTNLQHFAANQGTIGAGSTVTNQYGFLVQATLTGATNNYGFYSNIASGTGRWNFYAAGTAANYFAGSTTLNGLVTALSSKTGNYTLTATDITVLGNATSGSITLTLPTAVGVTGQTYFLKKTDSTANTVTVATTSSQTIDGQASKVLSIQYDGIQVASDGANWVITGMVFGRNGTAGSF